ncbi:Hypothetical predicted protein [Lecanosticta acicola]|uniref:Uncharacterized protein n=1 Tax=Lecanosticta acicola TaxID=111012 RepID=A0AAI8YYY8_9PEZI|nr:Hypothetical predicted protein [Lecanosticta acicola]
MTPRQETWRQVRAAGRQAQQERLNIMARGLPHSAFLGIARKNEALDNAALQIELENGAREDAANTDGEKEERNRKARGRRAGKKEGEAEDQVAAKKERRMKMTDKENIEETVDRIPADGAVGGAVQQKSVTTSQHDPMAEFSKAQPKQKAVAVAPLAKKSILGAEKSGNRIEQANLAGNANDGAAQKKPVNTARRTAVGKRTIDEVASLSSSEDEQGNRTRKKTSAAAGRGIAKPPAKKAKKPVAAGEEEEKEESTPKKKPAAAKKNVSKPVAKKTKKLVAVDYEDPLLQNCGGEKQWPLFPGRAQRKPSNTIGIAQIPLTEKDDFSAALKQVVGFYFDRGGEIIVDEEGAVVLRFPLASTAQMVKDEIDGKEVAGKKVQVTYVVGAW